MKSPKKLHLEIVEDRENYVDLLLLADESKEIVQEYMNSGELFAITYGNRTIGICLFTFHPNEIVEIKNIALISSFRNQGFGKMVIKQAFEHFSLQRKKEVIVGTANSSISNIVFYQKAGFRFSHIVHDYFLRYPQPIIENGIRALDMIMFRKKLTDYRANLSNKPS